MSWAERIAWGLGLAAGVACVAWAWWGPGPVRAAVAPAGDDAWPVVRVIDGDTFLVLYHGVGTSIRLAEVDAPEGRADPEGKSRQALTELIGGRHVALHPLDPTGRARDARGRLVCLVSVEGQDVGSELVRRGVAVNIKDRVSE